MMTRRFARLRREGGASVWAELIAGEAHALDRAPWLGGEPTGERLGTFSDDGVGPLARLAPVEPRKILCVGRNYHAHAKELGNEVPAEPMLFYKPTTSILDPDGVIELPPPSIAQRVEHEAELALVVGARLKRATREQAEAAIFGLTLACDVTARDLQKKDGQWWRAKGMDTFCPVGPVVVTGLDAGDLLIVCRVNDHTRQQGSTGQMIFDLPTVLAHVSQTITLEPGDLILTGTPEGVGPLVHGDTLHIDVAPIGRLTATVQASP